MHRTDLAPVLSATSNRDSVWIISIFPTCTRRRQPQRTSQGLQISQSVLGPSSACKTICSTSRWAETSRIKKREALMSIIGAKHFGSQARVMQAGIQILWRQRQKASSCRSEPSSSRRMRATTGASSGLAGIQEQQAERRRQHVLHRAGIFKPGRKADHGSVRPPPRSVCRRQGLHLGRFAAMGVQPWASLIRCWTGSRGVPTSGNWFVTRQAFRAAGPGEAFCTHPRPWPGRWSICRRSR